MSAARPASLWRPRASGVLGPRALALACLLAGVAAPGAARAGWPDDVLEGKPYSFCPLVFGPGCRSTLSLDLVAAYQPTESDDNGSEPYARVGVEAALSRRIDGDFHLGPAFEIGVQDGRFMTGFHTVPKVRARYWIAGSPVSLDLAAGFYAGRAWLDTGDAPRNRFGYQMDAGLGLFGTVHFIGGFAVLEDPSGVYGAQTQGFVGARFSFPALGLGALFGLSQAFKR